MIPRERASVVVVHDGRLLAVALEDPTTKITRFFLPGGALEPDETPADAARRETLEETGYGVTIDESSMRSRRYAFRWNGADYNCLTHFFAACLTDPSAAAALVDDAPYHRGVAWVPLGEVSKTFNYDEFIYQEILAMLAERT